MDSWKIIILYFSRLIETADFWFFRVGRKVQVLELAYMNKYEYLPNDDYKHRDFGSQP